MEAVAKEGVAKGVAVEVVVVVEAVVVVELAEDKDRAMAVDGRRPQEIPVVETAQTILLENSIKDRGMIVTHESSPVQK